MKKVLIISFLIFTILMSSLITSYASQITLPDDEFTNASNNTNTNYIATTVTEESLEESFKKLTESDGDEASEISYSMKIDKENKKITISEEDEDYIIDYDLSDKPTFKIDVSFNNKMTENEFQTEYSTPASIFLVIFTLIGDNKGISPEDSQMYMLESLLKNDSSSKPITFTTAIETAKAMYDNELSYSDDLYTLTYKKILETNDEYKVQATMLINNNADFSVMEGVADNTVDSFTNSIMSQFKNAIDENSKLQEEENRILENYMIFLNAAQKNWSTIKKLPQTGNFFEFKDGLYLLCIVSSIALVYIVFKAIKYRNIEK